jgi:hypothetical protein
MDNAVFKPFYLVFQYERMVGYFASGSKFERAERCQIDCFLVSVYFLNFCLKACRIRVYLSIGLNEGSSEHAIVSERVFERKRSNN